MDFVENITVDALCGSVVDGKYRVTELLGRGGMGTVYRAVHQTMGMEVALKVLHERLLADAAAIARFKREAQFATAVEHPHVVKTFGFGLIEARQPYMVMELVIGEALSERMRRAPICDELLAVICAQCCEAYQHLHTHGIVHRDIKPSNILLVAERESSVTVKISDFGIAKAVSSDEGALQRLTQTGELLGSPQYMSPEQCASQGLDARSDIYSFGCVIYELLTGRAPFNADSPFQLMMQHLQEQPVPPSAVLQIKGRQAQLMDEIVLKALAKSPSDRYSSFHEFGAALTKLPWRRSGISTGQAQPRVNRIPWKTVFVGGMSVLAAASAITFLQTKQQPAESIAVEPIHSVPKEERMAMQSWLSENCPNWKKNVLGPATVPELAAHCDRFIAASFVRRSDGNLELASDFLTGDMDEEFVRLNDLGNVLDLRYECALENPKALRLDMDSWRAYFHTLQHWQYINSYQRNYEFIDRFIFCLWRTAKCMGIDGENKMDALDTGALMRAADSFGDRLKLLCEYCANASIFSDWISRLPWNHVHECNGTPYRAHHWVFRTMQLQLSAKSAFLAGQLADSASLCQKSVDLLGQSEKFKADDKFGGHSDWPYGTSLTREWERHKSAIDEELLLLCSDDNRDLLRAKQLTETNWKSDSGSPETKVQWALTAYTAFRNRDMATARTWIGWLNDDLLKPQPIMNSPCPAYDFRTQIQYARFLSRLYGGMISARDGKTDEALKNYKAAILLAPQMVAVVQDHASAAVNAVTLMQAQNRYRRFIEGTVLDNAEARDANEQVRRFFDERPELRERCSILVARFDS